ncbi:MAG: histidinol-phosphatase [Bacteroidales bacterium]|nr:histidinol-phosphatase [Bacteroidales bacterium]
MKPDFAAIVASMRLYNFHTHTQFCDGHSSIDEMARAAVEGGFSHIGFTPHSPVGIPSPCNMSADDVPAYLAAVDSLNDRYGDRCRFYKGMEIDYLGPACNAADSYFSDLGLDFAISSVHFIPAQNGELIDIDGRYERFRTNMLTHFGDDIRYVVETFYSRSIDMLRQGGFDILGHFDKISQNASYHHPGIEDEGWYRSLIDDYIARIIDSGVIVEINTKARAEHGRFFPGVRYWQRLIDAGVPVLVNSDAHYADRLSASRDEAFDILDSLGYGC